MLNKINGNIEALLSRINIRKLFLILFIFFGSILISVFVVSRYKTIYKAVYEERIEKLKYVVEFAQEILKDEDVAVKQHKKNLKNAQEEVIGVLKDVKFENNNYIWVMDDNGKAIYHPNSNIIGKNVKALTDPFDNKNLGEEIINDSQKSGSAYIHYHWIKDGDKTKNIYNKVCYVERFKDWGWIVGAGLYVDDIKMKVIQTMLNGYLSVITVSIFIILILRYIILATIIKPIEELADKSLKLVNNDLTVTIPERYKDNEFKKLYNAFNNFVEFFKEKEKYEKKLSLIHENINDVLITINDNGIIQFVNPSIEKVFGYTPQEIIGKNVNMLTSPTLIGEHIKCFKENKHFNGKYEISGIKKSEEFFDIEINISEVLYDDENIFILLIRDITKQNEVNQMKNEFVSIVSHELRTPLTSIRGSLGLLTSGAFPAITGKAKDLLDIAHNNSLRLINLINDILDIEKIIAGKMEFYYETMDIAQNIENIISLNKPYAEKFKIKYKFKNNLKEGESFTIDKNRFNQIITNLLSNAAKFSPEDSEVLIFTDYKDNFIRISIEDKGQGIPPEFKNKIFDKFTQADSSDTRQKGGTGLGLSICKSLVEKMGGNISFETEINKGTVFHVDFPMSYIAAKQ